jgi:hypothetical protein
LKANFDVVFQEDIEKVSVDPKNLDILMKHHGEYAFRPKKAYDMRPIRTSVSIYRLCVSMKTMCCCIEL